MGKNLSMPLITSLKRLGFTVAGLTIIQFAGTIAHGQTSQQVYTYRPDITFQNKTCQTHVQTQADSTVPNSISFDCYPVGSPKGTRTTQCSFRWQSSGQSTFGIHTYSDARVRHHNQDVQTNFSDLKTTANTAIAPDPNVGNKASMDKIGAFAQKWMEENCTADVSKLKATSVNTYENIPFAVDDSKACKFSSHKENKKVLSWSVDCENQTQQPHLQCTVTADASKDTAPYLKTRFSKDTYSNTEQSELQTSTTMPAGDMVLSFWDFRKIAIKYLKESCQDVLYPKKKSDETKNNNSKKAE